MGRECLLCPSGSKKNKNEKSEVTLHKFPNDGTLRDKWCEACALSNDPNVNDLSNVKICSLHFRAVDYDEPKAKLFGGRLVLKRNAVPSISMPYRPRSAINISATSADVTCKTDEASSEDENHNLINNSEFVEPPYVELANTADSPVKIHNEPEETEVCRTPTKRTMPLSISEIKTPDMACPKRARRVLSLIKRIDSAKSSQIKSLQNKQRYLMTRIVSLQGEIDALNTQGRHEENTLMAD